MTCLATMALSIAVLSAGQPADAADRHVAITVQIKSGKPFTLTAEELGKLGRAKVQTGKDKNQRTYEGVPLAEVLRVAGVEWHGSCSPLLTCYVLVEGADGYRVLFSIPEIDPQQRHKMVILADRCDGKPLSGKDGPYQTIEEDAKQHGRWVKQVKTVSLQAVAGPPLPAH